jgi:hypothetical protein
VATGETKEVGGVPSKIPESARSAINHNSNHHRKVPKIISETYSPMLLLTYPENGYSFKLRYFITKKQANLASRFPHRFLRLSPFRERGQPGKKKARTKGSGFSVEFID